MNRILVIIPSYNEEITIKSVVSGVKTALPYAEILVVDDGSEDETSKRAKETGVLVAKLHTNSGYGLALQVGYNYAEKNNIDFTIQMDADGQHDPEALSSILKTLNESDCDIVIGSRHVSYRSSSYRVSLIRKIGIKILALITTIIIRKKITDPTSGFIGFKRKVIRFLVSENFPHDYPDANVIIMLNRLGFAIREIAVNMSKGKSSSMHSGLKPIWYIFRMIYLLSRACFVRKAKLEDMNRKAKLDKIYSDIDWV